MITIGIPRALLYYRYGVLWETFFQTLGMDVLVSGRTDKEIMSRGAMYAIDESCLSSKVYLGHVDQLMGKCDMIFVPRVASLGARAILCTKFEALTDIVTNTFRDRGVKVLDCNIDVRKSAGEMSAFIEVGKRLGKKRPQVLYAYMIAKQAEREALLEALRRQDALLERPGLKILVVAHGYNAHDPYIGGPVLEGLRQMGVTPILADIADRKLALEQAETLTTTLPWVLNRELVGAVQLYRSRVDGIILLSAFPCGPDSLVNEMIQRRVKGIPMLNLLVDGQEGSAGLETRLESFVDIIGFQSRGGDALHG